MYSKKITEIKTKDEILKLTKLPDSNRYDFANEFARSFEEIGYANFSQNYIPLIYIEDKKSGFDGILLGRDNKVKFFESKTGKSSLKALWDSAIKTIVKPISGRKTEIKTISDRISENKKIYINDGQTYKLKLSKRDREEIVNKMGEILDNIADKKTTNISADESIIWLGMTNSKTSKVNHENAKLTYDYGVIIWDEEHHGK